MIINRLRGVWRLGVRAQLTLWYTAVFATLILLFSIILYTTIQASLASGVDTALQLRTQQIAGGISSEGGKITIQDVTGELPESGTSTTKGQPNNCVSDANQTGHHGA